MSLGDVGSSQWRPAYAQTPDALPVSPDPDHCRGLVRESLENPWIFVQLAVMACALRATSWPDVTALS